MVCYLFTDLTDHFAPPDPHTPLIGRMIPRILDKASPFYDPTGTPIRPASNISYTVLGVKMFADHHHEIFGPRQAVPESGVRSTDKMLVAETPATYICYPLCRGGMRRKGGNETVHLK